MVVIRLVTRVRGARQLLHHTVNGRMVPVAIGGPVAVSVPVAAGVPVAVGGPVAVGVPVAAMVPVPTLADAVWPGLHVHVQPQQKNQNHTAVQLDTI